MISGLIDEFEWPNDRRHLNSRHCKIRWGTASCIQWYFIWFNIDCHYHNIRTAHARIQKVSLGGRLVGGPGPSNRTKLWRMLRYTSALHCRVKLPYLFCLMIQRRTVVIILMKERVRREPTPRTHYSGKTKPRQHNFVFPSVTSPFILGPSPLGNKSRVVWETTQWFIETFFVWLFIFKL